jgi:predicted hydrolase (HD superfamily)
LESVKKKFANRAFAAGADRDGIMDGIGRMEKQFDFVLEETLKALQARAEELGL